MSAEREDMTTLLEAELEELRAPYAGEDAFRAGLRARLERRAHERLRRRRRLRGASLRAVVVACAGAAAFGALQLGGVVGGGSSSASAAGVLRVAAAAGPTVDEVQHLVYDFTVDVPAGTIPAKAAGPSAGSVDVWVAPDRSSQTLELAKGPGDPTQTLARVVQVGSSSFGYDASHEALTLPSEPDAVPAIVLPNESYDGASTARTLQRLAAQGAQVRRLAERTLAGVPVEAVEAAGLPDRPALRLTLYFDANTGLLRGFDAGGEDPSYPMPSWQVRLREASTMPASAAPSGAFALQLPPGTARVAFRPQKRAFGAICAGAGKLPAASLLASCRAGEPSITPEALAARLARPFVAELRTAVADGVIGAEQAAVAQGGLEAEMRRAVQGAPAARRSSFPLRRAAAAGRHVAGDDLALLGVAPPGERRK